MMENIKLKTVDKFGIEREIRENVINIMPKNSNGTFGATEIRIINDTNDNNIEIEINQFIKDKKEKFAQEIEMVAEPKLILAKTNLEGEIINPNEDVLIAKPKKIDRRFKKNK